MKLRGNKLKPLRFDPSGAYLRGLGIRESDVNRVAKELESIRDSIASPNEQDSFETAFYSEPKRLLLEYQEDRHGSELAKLFKVANRMHAAVDRVVVIGIDGVDCGARSFLDGCCQPYWNELSRGSRGSKPRMNFDGNNFDNDATQGLLSLLNATEGRPSNSELDAWGLIVVGDDDETIAALRPFIRALKASCAGDMSKVQQRLVAITGTQGLLRRELNEIGCRDFFPFPDFKRNHQSLGFTALTSIGLVPAAMLGINVIELLVGAVALNDHFEKAPAEDNSVLQFAALNSLLASHPCISGRIVSPLNQSLKSLRSWYQRLLERDRNDSVGSTSTTKISANETDSTVGTVPIPADDTTASGIAPAALIQARRFRVPLMIHFVVEECRFDPLATTDLGIDSESSDRSVSDGDACLQSIEQTLPGLYRSSVAKLAESCRKSGIPTANLFIPQVDELHLGQLMQMLMVSTAIERTWTKRFGREPAHTDNAVPARAPEGDLK